MQVEKLIEELKKMPPNYEVRAFEEGIEVEDFLSDILDIVLWSPQKEVRLIIETNREIDPNADEFDDPDFDDDL